MIILITALVTYQIQEWRWSNELATHVASYKKQLAEIDRVSNAKLVAQQTKRVELEERLAQINAVNYQELTNAQQANYKLINDLANARERLSIAVTRCTADRGGLSKATQGGGVDNETTRADIDPRHAAAIITITDRGDEAIRRLNACQDYIEELSK